MKSKGIFFCTDKGYLLPTLVACSKLLEQRDLMAAADIIVCLVDFSDDEQQTVEALFARDGLVFVRQSSAGYVLPADASYNHTHVPLTALARLTAPQVLPEHYQTLLYLDGDIAIEGRVLPLLDAAIPQGMLGAVSEHFHLIRHEAGGHSQRIHAYLQGLGIVDPCDYFNSGVIVASRETWLEIGQKALAFIMTNSKLCIYHDQSALNAISVGRRVHLHPCYNVHSWFQTLGKTMIPNRVVVHFTGGEKPWTAKKGHKYFKYRSDYDALLRDYPTLASIIPAHPSDQSRTDRRYMRRCVSSVTNTVRHPKRVAALSGYLASRSFVP